METEEKYRVAPPGFTAEQWKTFNEDGIIFIEDAISEAEVQTYIDAIDCISATSPKYTPSGYLGMENIVERDPVFTNLIDHERHVGYAYDLFGELLKLHQSQFFPTSTRRQTVQSMASGWSTCTSLRCIFTRIAVANQNRILADRSAEREYGKSRRVTGKPQAPVYGRLRYTQKSSGRKGRLSA